jgi:hypothetical protein
VIDTSLIERRPEHPRPPDSRPHLHEPVTASPVQTRDDPTYLNAADECVSRARMRWTQSRRP